MKNVLPESFIGKIRKEEGLCVILSGNIYDVVPTRNIIFERIEELLQMSSISFKFFIEFSVSQGAKVMEIFIDDQRKERRMRDGAEKFIQMVIPQEDFEAARDAGMEIDLSDPVKFFKLIHKFIEAGEFDGQNEEESKKRKRERRSFILIRYPEAIIPQNEMTTSADERALVALIKDIARDPKVKEGGHVVCLLTKHADDLEKSLFDRDLGISQIRIGKPDLKTRLEFLRGLEVKEDVETAAKITAGISLRMIKEIVQDASGSDVIQKIFGAKRQILTEDYGSILSVMNPKWGFECIGGLEKQIAMLRKISRNMRNGRWDLVPQGILFTGPPGTGKTVCVEALAKEAQINIVSPGSIRSKWVGDTEKHLKRFIDACIEMSPVIVFVDEGDNAFGNRGDYDGSGGVERRFLQKILEVMSDSSLRGKILWVSATNRPDLMDSALLRPGRFSLRIPFMYPTATERDGIFRAILNKYSEIKTDITEFAEFAELTEDRNGADIESILVELAWPYTNDSGRDVMTREDLLFAIDDFIPQGLRKEEISAMIQASIKTCHSKSLLPAIAKNVRKPREPSVEIEEVVMVDLYTDTDSEKVN